MVTLWIDGKKEDFNLHGYLKWPYGPIWETVWKIGIFNEMPTLMEYKGRLGMKKYTFDRKLGRQLKMWQESVLSTAKVNHKSTEKHIKALYASLNMSQPQKIVWSQSPMGALLIMNAASQSKWWRHMHHSLRNTLRQALNNSFIRVKVTPAALHTWKPRFSVVGSQHSRLWESVTQSVNAQHRNWYRHAHTWRTAIKAGLVANNHLWCDFSNSIEYLEISKQALAKKNVQQHRYPMASSEDWISLFFMRGIRDLGRGWPNFNRVLRAHENLQKEGVLLWLFDDLVFCSERPTEIKTERFQAGEPPLLHNTNGPVMKFRDGAHTYAWRGQHIPAEWTDSNWFTPGRIHLEKNGSTFRQMLRIYGLNRYILDASDELKEDDCPRRIAKDEWGELWEIPHDTVAIRAVVVENSTMNSDGTRSTYALTVPPGCESPESGLLELHGLPHTLRYRPAVES